MNRRDFLKHLCLLPMAPLLDQVSEFELYERQGRANVIIVVFDALSAHHLSLHGYQRETTPNLARFAERAVVYHKHYAGGNFTTPGTASLLTGTYPWRNRAFNYGGRMERAYRERNIFKLLGSDYNIIAYPQNRYAHLLLDQLIQNIDTYIHPTTFSLSDDRFYTRLLSGDVTMGDRAFEELLVPSFGVPASLFLALGYAIKELRRERSSAHAFERRYPRGIPSLNAYHTQFLVEDVVRGMTAELAEVQQPFLAYLHFYPPHDPYRPRREFIDIFRDDWSPVTKTEHLFSEGHSQEFLNEQRTWYDEYIAQVDAEFGRMCDRLRRRGLMGNSYIIFTSDHGELFERGVCGHGTPLLYDPLIRVPLIVSTPRQEKRTDVHAPTSCVDLLPTLLHLTGQTVPDWCEGQLLPGLGGERGEDHAVFSVEAKENATTRPLTRGTIAMIKGAHKLIHYFGYPGYENEYELYNLDNDPEELENLYDSKTSIAANLRYQLTQKLKAVNDPYRP